MTSNQDTRCARGCRSFLWFRVYVEIARTVGRVEGQQAALGFTLAFEDLAIGVTALQLGYKVVTTNLKHFQQIPGLKVVQPA